MILRNDTTDIDQATILARDRAKNDPRDWRYVFNLVLHYTSTENSEGTEQLYEERFCLQDSKYADYSAISDLDEFIRLFPNQK